MTEMIENTGLGPQYGGDTPFGKRMRRHQSWYRACVLRLPFGTGPGPNDTGQYGNMLTRQDGKDGRNFLTPEIANVVRERLALGGGVLEVYRLRHNMLSSQPMCFNLFGPLVRDFDLARRLLAALVPEKVAHVTRVEIEWAPQPAFDYLNDHTAFDAFIEYLTVDGRMSGLGIETKLSEPFSQKEYDRSEYRRWMEIPDSPWRPDAWEKVSAKAHNQLWRDHLLAVALRSRRDSPFSVTHLMLVRHPLDNECAHITAGYKQLLRDGNDTLLDMPLDQLVERWLSVIGEGPHYDWLTAFKLRYLDLELSEVDC